MGLALPKGKSRNDSATQNQSDIYGGGNSQGTLDPNLMTANMIFGPTPAPNAKTQISPKSIAALNALLGVDSDNTGSTNTPQDDIPMQLPQAPFSMQAPVPMVPPMAPPMGMAPILPPTAVPSTSAQPFYHPSVGWFYPATPSSVTCSGLTTPVAQEGYTPLSTTPLPPSAPPSRFPTPAPGTVYTHRQTKPKRKYGPAAYLDEQAKNQAQGITGARSVSISEATYTSAAKKRGDKGVGSGPPTQKAFVRKNAAPTIVQACVCQDKNTQKVPRPKNAFILYRSAHSKQILKKNKTNNNHVVSRVAAEQWRAESPEVKAKYYQMAEAEKERHKQLYPGYVYQPGVTGRNKFGSVSCVCGAYQANMAAMKAAQDAQNADDASEESDLEEYVPPSTTQQAAPVAPMMQANSLVLSRSGLTASEEAATQAFIADLKRKRSAANPAADQGQPVAKRRSPRLNNAQEISYAEPDENDIFAPATPAAEQVSNPPLYTMSTYNNPMQPPQTPPMGAFDPTILEDSPSRNTRASVAARAQQQQMANPYDAGINFDFGDNFDFNDPNDNVDFTNEALDWTELFGMDPTQAADTEPDLGLFMDDAADALVAEENVMEETIVVARTRTSSRSRSRSSGSSKGSPSGMRRSSRTKSRRRSS